MSQLIQLKQRIKAIGVIKKITHAMRLISMSSHSKLKKQSKAMQHFKDELRPLLCALTRKVREDHPQNIKPQFKTLFIIFAAEKGLCGNFNSTMYGYFNKTLTPQALENSHVIAVGKKAADYLEKKEIEPIVSLDKALPNKLDALAQKLYETILEKHESYEHVICLYSYPKTFFLQEPQQIMLTPVQPDSCELSSQINLNEYVWPQDIKSVTTSLFHLLLKMNILLILTNSMLSEQSARFLSMDNSTRSAENLLKSMKLEFNKIRQAKITRELIELIANF